ncbi:MAG: MBL fold metallo-hydrolase RNA specificity domain-containing protein [Burkholderiaceae bacterium]
MQIQFLGATNTVTGSKHLVSSGKTKILVDCGLFQGYKQLRLRNWDQFPVDPAEINAVVLTHAHLDHSGYLPILVRDGFQGKIYCSEATYDLCKILLPDSGRLLEEDADYANRHGFSKHKPALPLYTEADAHRCLKFFHPIPFGKRIEVSGPFTAEMHHAGHILGAAIVVLRDQHRTLTFSGDLGRPNDPILLPPETIESTDYLVIESTYGNRVQDKSDPGELLAKTIQDTLDRGGVTIIPTFAVGRTQTLLYYLHKLKQTGKIPAVLPIYVNSPMAVDATSIYRKHKSQHCLNPEQCHDVFNVAKMVNSIEDSIWLNQQRRPMVIIAGSGMATGGRVLHHLKAFASDRRNTILFSGYQAGGTRGAAMLAGADSIKIHGEYIPLRAHVAQIANLSAHADRDEIMAWLSHFKSPPKQTFIVHGEPDAADALRRTIEEKKKWRCLVPEYLQRYDLS